MKDVKGFLLFEVIISIVMITTGLLFVMRAYSSSKEALERSRDLFKSSLLLEKAAFEFEEKNEIEEGSKEEIFNDDKDYSWSIRAESQEGSSLNMNIVTLNVFQAKDALNTKYSLATYLKNKSR